MALQQNNKISASDFNALFTSLEATRQKHVARPGLTDAQKTALSTSYNTSVANTGIKIQPSAIQAIKDNLTNLSNSPDIEVTFSNNIVKPEAGDLIQATTVSTAETNTNDVSNLCANCSYNSSYNSNYNSSYNSGHNSFYHSQNWSF